MRISDLARSTDVPVATIKYYLREGLVPSGSLSAPNQAVYDERHVHRLRLIRVLLEVGGLSIAHVREVLRAVDDPSVPVHDMLGVAHGALAGRRLREAEDPGAAGTVDSFLGRRGWRVAEGTAARRELVGAVAALRALGWRVDEGTLEPYAAAIDGLAADEVRYVLGDGSRDELVERAVIGTVVFDAALSALRRLAQEHHSAGIAAGE